MNDLDTDLRPITIRDVVEFLERRGVYQPSLLEDDDLLADLELLDDEQPPSSCEGIVGVFGQGKSLERALSPVEEAGSFTAQVDFDRLFDDGGDWFPFLDDIPDFRPEGLTGDVRKDVSGLLDIFDELEAPYSGPWIRGVSEIEAGAWYQPAHFFGANVGIYIREEAVIALAVVLYRRLVDAGELADQATQRRATRAAFGLYYLHECFHHKVESFGFRLHVATNVGVFRPYHSLVYRKTFGSDDCLEEAIANAHAFAALLDRQGPWLCGLRSRSKKVVEQFIRELYDSAPPGYRCWSSYAKPMPRRRGMRFLQSQVLESTSKPILAERDWVLAPHLLKAALNTRSITTLLSAGRKERLPVLASPAPPVQGRKLKSFLKTIGFRQDKKRGKGSHQQFARDNPPPRSITIPDHRELSPGLIAKVARDLGMTVADLRLGTG